ncbi:L,D-transpeptidase family protein [Halobacteriovorax sp. GB3]|uniref:L,D-transpeptidase family protein n=1 Tax=Halobacteriovorax sp. GB3 TaxID=2719615 RepID=UPI002361BA19|nr:L,D-transpeptidase family protein [Halobacteriovorax sp. GB3]MDD0853367.1 L,D-transpeptidase family protein [Halobacteriovorax sp. GB3]
MKNLMLLFVISVLSLSSFARERVVVYKSKRIMQIYQNDELIKEFPVMLGSNPNGPKRQEGDRKTPEGEYILDYHNPESRFYLSVHVNYPNDKDLEYARENKIDNPGNEIFIHGLPKKVLNKTNSKEIYQFLKRLNWTWGCIALSNENMKFFYDFIPDGTPLIIYP